MLAQGAKEVVVSLWDLDDQSTYKIIQSFYNQSIPNLRTAKLNYLETNPDKSMPYFWAGLQ